MYQGRKLFVSKPNTVDCIVGEFNLKIENPNQVIIKNMYSHISAGTELACIAGIESWFNIPDVPGYTSIGKIIETGENVSHVQVGDIVYTYGHHAEYFVVDVTDRWHGVCVKVPSDVDLELAAFTHMVSIAFTSIRKSNIELGDYVLVTGLGVIGNMAAQLAQLQGANVIATDINNDRIRIAEECGIRNVINSSEQDLKASIEKISSGKMISTYIDASGITAVIAQGADMLAFNGEVILLGSPRAPYENNVTDFLKHFHYLPWCGNLKGALEFTIPTHQTDFNKHSIERNAEIILNLIKDERLILRPCYSQKITPEMAQSAYDGLKNNPNEYVGVIIDWN